MILISPFSTQSNNDNNKKYNFRAEEDIRRFVHYTLRGNICLHPIYTGARGFRSPVTMPNAIADEMISIQCLHNKLSGLRIRGLILTVSKDELCAPFAQNQIAIIAERFSDYIFLSGFQTTYGVFEMGNCYEIYYAINTVSFINGVKFRQNTNDILDDEQLCAETIVCEVTGRTAMEVCFDFDSLEYA